jgi:hypothetical protein
MATLSHGTVTITYPDHIAIPERAGRVLAGLSSPGGRPWRRITNSRPPARTRERPPATAAGLHPS